MARARSLKPDVVPLGAKRCTNCKRVKPAESFRATPVEADRRRHRTPQRAAQQKAYRKTPLGRLLHSRRQMVRRQAERLAAGRLDAHAKGEALLAQYDAEIARLRAALDGEGRRGPRPRRAFGSTEKDVTR